MSVASLLGPGNATCAEVAAHLDGLGAGQRLTECLALSPAEQRRLWTLASAAPGESQRLLAGEPQAVFAGRNTLRLFTRFEKRFALLDDAVVGHNHHRLSPVIGPGYFTVAEADAGLRFDYRRVPRSAPPGWPAVKSNASGLAKTVYGDLVDDVVWVAKDVLIGSARRGDEPLDSYFILVRA